MPDRGADELGQVGGHRDDLGLQPEHHVRPAAEPFPAQFGQAAAGGQPGLGGEVLHQDGHQVGHHDDPHQLVAVLGAAGEVGGEVPRVDVGDRGHERRAQQARRRADPAPRLHLPQRDLAAGRGPGGGHDCDHAMHQMGQRDSHGAALAAGLDPQRPAERLPLQHPQHYPGPHAQAGQILQGGAVLVADPVHPEPRTRGNAGQRRRPVLDVVPGGLRNRVAVRIPPRMPQRRVDPVDQQVADRVLQRFGLVVHLIPAHPGGLHQEGLDQPVPPDHVPGMRLAVLAQRDAAAARCGQQARRAAAGAASPIPRAERLPAGPPHQRSRRAGP